MSQQINITVRGKIAETDFREVVSFNSVYRLKFDLDGEWNDFPSRVAVVMWAGGAAEKLFTGEECDMPEIPSLDSETALVGVYSRNGEKRIASSFVRLSCRAGACGAPQERPVDSLHEQILSFLNGKDWSIFEEKIAGGIYSAVRVNPIGLVTEGWNVLEVGSDGRSEPTKLVPGGIFFRLENGVYVPYYKNGASLEPLTMGAAKLSGGLTVGEKRFDGSEDVTISPEDLGLADVATSGSYHDLLDAPDLDSIKGAVTSVNGRTGDVTVSKYDLDLADVALSGDYNDLLNRPEHAVTSVNGKTGDVTVSKYDLDLAEVALTGDYDDLVNKPTHTVTSVNGQTGAVTVSKYDLDLAEVALSGDYNDLLNRPEQAVTSVNGRTGDVTVSKYDLDLAQVAITGSYEDLTDKPEFAGGGVTSVNGKTGKVTVSKYDLDLGNVTNDKQFPVHTKVQYGIDLNTLTSPGLYEVIGLTGQKCTNAPASSLNLSSADCQWFIMVFVQSEGDGAITQVAFSARADNSMRMRCKSGGIWQGWKGIA